MSSSFKRRFMKFCATAHGGRWAALAVAGVLSAIAPPSFAADKPVAAPSDSLEEIVVTAEFRSEKLQNVPIAITALSGIAFMADGNLPGRGKYGDNVRKAVDFIIRNQQESGLFTTNASQGEMYSHGFSTLFIGEVYGMTGDDQIKENLQKALRHVLLLQLMKFNAGYGRGGLGLI